jgi:hypothetical protein
VASTGGYREAFLVADNGRGFYSTSSELLFFFVTTITVPVRSLQHRVNNLKASEFRRSSAQRILGRRQKKAIKVYYAVTGFMVAGVAGREQTPARWYVRDSLTPRQGVVCGNIGYLVVRDIIKRLTKMLSGNFRQVIEGAVDPLVIEM